MVWLPDSSSSGTWLAPASDGLFIRGGSFDRACHDVDLVSIILMIMGLQPLWFREIIIVTGFIKKRDIT